MRDKSKQLLVINTGKKKSEQTGMPSQSGTTHIIGGGGLSVNMSDYLLKSIWDKVFEIRTDSQGKEYIFGKLPVVTQYGITMYSGDGVDIPSLASGLPFDGRTIWYNPDTNQIEVIGGTGGGSGEGVSNFWDLSGIPSWITNSKPKYTYSEIEGTPDLTQYALVSQIPSLSGYATESWVLQKNYATKATTLSGYGITDAYTKTNVDDLLKSYVTLGGTQTITGEKNFVGGLKVNGSPIYYDTEKKYWKLEGDLLVTGGVAMYGNEGTFTPSTIMDAILYDSATLGINSNGQLYVKGGTSGGGLDITALQNYLTQNSYLNVTSGDNRYLKLSGGTLTLENGDSFKIRRNKSNSYGAYISYETNDGILGRLGMYRDDVEVYFGSQTAKSHRLLHEGNYSNYALPLSGGTMNGVITMPINYQIQWGSSSMMIYGEDTNAIKIVAPLGLYVNSKEVWHKGNFTPSNYLPLSGGTLSSDSRSPLKLKSGSSENHSLLTFNRGSDYWGSIGFSAANSLIFKDTNGANFSIWHSDNDGSGSGLDADLLDGNDGSWYLYNVLGFARQNYTNNNAAERDANAVINGMLYNYGSTNYWKNTPSGFSYGQILSLSSGSDTALTGQLAWDVNHESTTDTTKTLWWRCIQNKDRITYAKWHQIAFTDSNVASATQIMLNYSYNQNVDYPIVFASRDNIGTAKNGGLYLDFYGRPTYNPSTNTLSVANLSGNSSSATKLQTARTIWGQSFDGTGNVDGVITINQSTTNASILINSTHASLPQSFITFQSNGVDKGNVGWTNASGTHLYNASTRKTLELTNDGELKYGAAANGVVIWRADNSNLSTVNWTVSDLYCYCNGAERQFVVSKKSYTWGGLVNSYPLIGTTSTADNNIYTMLAFPHIPYLKNGSRNYNGNSFGSLVRFEGDVTNGKYWDVGCPYDSPNNLFIRCDGKNIASWGDSGLMGIYVPNLWLSYSMLVLGRKDASLMTNQYAQIGVTDGNIHVDAYKGYGIYLNFYQNNTGVIIDKDCNLLVSGGITMYSDQRKKTILNHVELSLKQIADAPLIEHYYNSDDAKTTHVGSIAQYWANMNDWFCKLDSEGFYTMEIQNAALASAISIARELDRYETKTDKAIKKLKKRICELEEEVERLKRA